MKVVKNNCYGGFNISVQAQKDMIAMGCEHLNKVDFDEYFGRHITSLDEVDERGYTLRNSLEFSGVLYDCDKRVVYLDGDNTRTCEHLIKLIETKGSSYCSGKHAELVIVDVPDGACWDIDEYDGWETVEECHRTFG